MMKGVYPYDWASNHEVFSHTQLPPRESFYSKLKEEHVTERDYERALHVFDDFDCQTFLDYMMLYVKTDTGKYNVMSVHV